jgi:hypothetical protein
VSAVLELVTRSPVARRERRLRLPGAAIDRDFAAPAQHRFLPGGRRTREIPANALLAQLVEHFHGKEGVDGSSPSEGSGGSLLLTGGFARRRIMRGSAEGPYVNYLETAGGNVMGRKSLTSRGSPRSAR